MSKTFVVLAIVLVAANAHALRGLASSDTKCRVGMTAEVVNTVHSRHDYMIGQRGEITQILRDCGYQGQCNSGCYKVDLFDVYGTSRNFCKEDLLCGDVNPPNPSPSGLSNSKFAFGNAVKIINTENVQSTNLIGRTGTVESNRESCQGCTSCYQVRLDPVSNVMVSAVRGQQLNLPFFCENDLSCEDSSGCGSGKLPMPTATEVGGSTGAGDDGDDSANIAS